MAFVAMECGVVRMDVPVWDEGGELPVSGEAWP